MTSDEWVVVHRVESFDSDNPERQNQKSRLASVWGHTCGWRVRCRANSAHVRQSWPESGLCFQVHVLTMFQVVPSSLRSGWGLRTSPPGVTASISLSLSRCLPPPSSLCLCLLPPPLYLSLSLSLPRSLSRPLSLSIYVSISLNRRGLGGGLLHADGECASEAEQARQEVRPHCQRSGSRG